ncbi:ornithine-acyl-ACP acyltransferase [Loktanella sp. 5RATIMAR09]|uniref:GNAT family N-acetyltransferase n=1 Tax=Loktanella sp. 5RATIMAR09 TaxID=1225655 RepID=UPI0006EBA806|nr:GNAT family N-acetyltransferase [Loktanella sp. 5RATIMAR09]KQI72638.1 ornithine-acyl-ACP acyltransferase [Loktanella sp. 5RATIMAR09]
MTISFQSGRYAARFAVTPADLLACQRLRHRCFFGRVGCDADPYDTICAHMMVEDQAGRLVATARLLEIATGPEITKGYAAGYYDLSGLAQCAAPMIEIGRFCIAPDARDADVLRVAWGALTGLVDARGIAFLFGCTSFAGTDPAPYGQAFKRLAARHMGPAPLRPGVKSSDVVRFADLPPAGIVPMPPLLRTYLAMGGWVSDHAVIDRVMQTLHVFTCLDVAAVPPARAAALRALAQTASLP